MEELSNSVWGIEDVKDVAEEHDITLTDEQAAEWLKSREARRLIEYISEYGMNVLDEYFAEQ